MANRLRAAWSPGLWDTCPSSSTHGGLAAAAASATKASLASYSSGEETHLPSSPGTYASSNSPIRRGRHSWYGSPLIAETVERRNAKASSPSSAQDSADSLAETSRHILHEVNTQARFEALYRDGECRRKRREAIEREKVHREEEEMKVLQSKCQPRRRVWEPRWANEQSIAYARKQQALEDRRQREAVSKENQALKECSFAPRLVSGDGARRRKLAKARRILAELAEEQKIWTQRAQDLRGDLAHAMDADSDDDLDYDSDSKAFQCDLREADGLRAAADRRFRIGMLQVLDNLARLQVQALATVSRSFGQPSSRDDCEHPAINATQLRDVCPAFDVDLLPQLRAEVSRFDVPSDAVNAWEVPGALLRAPIPVLAPAADTLPLPKDALSSVDSTLQRDEARPWTWN